MQENPWYSRVLPRGCRSIAARGFVHEPEEVLNSESLHHCDVMPHATTLQASLGLLYEPGNLLYQVMAQLAQSSRIRERRCRHHLITMG
jgi:hypothetical protein